MNRTEENVRMRFQGTGGILTFRKGMRDSCKVRAYATRKHSLEGQDRTWGCYVDGGIQEVLSVQARTREDELECHF